ncbi:MAG: rod shape-determining protein MreC [Vulcanimicrobiaceae bacterium]
MFTYRDERRLFAVISVIIVAALVALIQVTASRAGVSSPLTSVTATLLDVVQTAFGEASIQAHTGAVAIGEAPRLLVQNRQLRGENAALRDQNAHLRELLAGSAAQSALDSTLSDYPRAIQARIIGFPPEADSEAVTVNKGSRQGVTREDGVLGAKGVVGRIVETSPFVSKVLLITDYTSSVPAMIQRGRWWGIAKGNRSSVRMEYISQDAGIRVGDKVITGEGRSFHSGALIGTIKKIERSPTGLYQTAVVATAADMSSLDRVVVIPK